MQKLRFLPSVKNEKLKWLVGFALVCVSCLAVIYWGMQSRSNATVSESIASFQSISEKNEAIRLLEPSRISGMISAETITIPFSDFSKVSAVRLDEALARCIPGDPRFSPMMESLSAYFKDGSVSGKLPSISFRKLNRLESLNIKNTLHFSR